MKYTCMTILVAGCLMSAPTAAAGSIYSTIEEAGEDYGDIYSTRGNRDIYTTEDKRQGLYTTKDNGTIYSTEDKREGQFATEEQPPSESGVDGVQGSDLKDSGGMEADNVYDGYMPGD